MLIELTAQKFISLKLEVCAVESRRRRRGFLVKISRRRHR